MNDTKELLNYIYQNARLGVISLDDLKNHISDIKLKEYVVDLYHDYASICDEAINYFIKLGHKETDLSTMIKVNTYISINVKSILDNSPKNIAKIIYDNSNTGIIAIKSVLNKFNLCDEDVRSLGNKLLKIEQKNLESLKKFL